MKAMNRWIYAIVGIITLVFVGLVYAWTVLQAPLSAHYPDWSAGSLSFTFTLLMICFCMGGLFGGILIKKLNARILMWISAVMLLLGFVISSKTTSIGMLYVGFGVFTGFGSGLAYNAVLSTVGKWFPDKPGLISGLLLMGFGIGSFIIGKVYTMLTPSDGGEAWRTSFFILGIVVFAVVLVGSFFIRSPGENWTPPASNGKKARTSYSEMNTASMVRTRAFWLFWLWAILLSAAGMVVMSQGTPIAAEACPGTDMGTIATIVGLISIFNGVGRIVFGIMFDRLGRFKEMLIGGILFILAIVLVIFSIKNHSMTLLIVSYIITGFSYGCITPTNSAFTSLYFGMKNYPVNYSIINMNLLIASFGSTAAGFIYDSTGSYDMVLIVTIVLIVIGTILSCLIRRPSDTSHN